MQNIATTTASKAIVAVVAAAMMFSAFAMPAKAATVAELEAQIAALMAQITALSGSSTTGGSSAAVCPYTWTRDLKTGVTGADVKKLQMFLNANADTRVAATGAGSTGMETETFGPATAAAVSKFQVMHRADILTPAGLTNPTGFFGPSTRAKANALCVTAPADEEDEDDEDSDDEDSEELSGEGSLDVFEIADASDDSIEEGATDEVVAELTMEATDGDIEISRMDIALETTGTEDPWDVFETITLWVDGEMVAEMAADDEDEYLDEDDGSLRFTGLDLVLREDEEVEMEIGASVQGSVDGTLPAAWTVQVDEVRYFDADGVATDDDSTDDLDPTSPATASFDIVAEGDGDELTIKSTSEDPDATTLQLEDDEKSDFMTVFAFELDTDDSDSDVEVTSLTVGVAGTSNGTTATTTALLISDAQLVVGDETYDDVTITHGTGGQFVFDLDDEDFMIEAGEAVTVEFQVEFKSLAALLEGATVQASTTGSTAEAEGADDITVTGSATGDEHTLRTEGAVLEFVSGSATKDINSDTTSTDDEGVFTLKFDVQAFETDLFINKTAASGTTMGTVGVNFQVTDGSGNAVGTTTPTAVNLSSTAETEGGQFKVVEGETETFTLSVEYDPGISGFYAIRLYSLNFKTTAGNPTVQQLALPEEDYETDPFSI